MASYHFIERIPDTEQLNKKVSIIPLEVVLLVTWLRVLSQNVFSVEEGLDSWKPNAEFTTKRWVGWSIYQWWACEAPDSCQWWTNCLYQAKKHVVSMDKLKDWFAQIVFAWLTSNSVFTDGKLFGRRISPDNCRLLGCWRATIWTRMLPWDLSSLTDVYKVVLEKLWK